MDIKKIKIKMFYNKNDFSKIRFEIEEKENKKSTSPFLFMSLRTKYRNTPKR